MPKFNQKVSTVDGGLLANHSYADEKTFVPVPENWELIETKKVDEVGLKANIYKNKNTDTIVVSFRGTYVRDKTVVKDLKNDIQIYFKKVPGSLKHAVKCVESVIKYSGGTDNVVIVGHSLGGAFAQGVAVTLGVPSMSFDSPGMKKILDDLQKTEKLAVKPEQYKNYICNILFEKNIVNDTNTQIGNVTRLKAVGQAKERIEKRIKALEEKLGENKKIVDAIPFAANRIDANMERQIEILGLDILGQRMHNAAYNTLDRHSMDYGIQSLIMYQNQVKIPIKMYSIQKKVINNKLAVQKREVVKKDVKKDKKQEDYAAKVEALQKMHKALAKHEKKLMREEYYKKTTENFAEVYKMGQQLKNIKLQKIARINIDALNLCNKADKLVENRAKLSKSKNAKEKVAIKTESIDMMGDIVDICGNYFNSKALNKCAVAIKAGSTIYSAFQALSLGGMSGFAALGPMGALVGGVMCISNLLSSGKAKAEQNAFTEIMKGIQALSKQIYEMHKDLKEEHAYTRRLLFTQIQEGIKYLDSVIRNEVSDSKIVITSALNEQKVMIKEIQKDLKSMEVENRIEGLNKKFKDADNSLLNKLPMPEDKGAEKDKRAIVNYDLVQAATIFASSSALTGAKCTIPLDDKSGLPLKDNKFTLLINKVLSKISSQENAIAELSSIMGFLNNYRNIRMQMNQNNDSLVNSTFWLIASDLYLKHRSKYPNAIAKNEDQNLQEIIDAGEKCTGFIKSVQSDEKFFDVLLNDYTESVIDFRKTFKDLVYEYFVEEANNLNSGNIVSIVKTAMNLNSITCNNTMVKQVFTPFCLHHRTNNRGNFKTSNVNEQITTTSLNFSGNFLPNLFNLSNISVPNAIAKAIELGFLRIKANYTPTRVTTRVLSEESDTNVANYLYHTQMEYTISPFVASIYNNNFGVIGSINYTANGGRSHPGAQGKGLGATTRANYCRDGGRENDIKNELMIAQKWNAKSLTSKGQLLKVNTNILHRNNLVQYLLTSNTTRCVNFRKKFLHRLTQNCALKVKYENALSRVNAFHKVFTTYAMLAGFSKDKMKVLRALPHDVNIQTSLNVFKLNGAAIDVIAVTNVIDSKLFTEPQYVNPLLNSMEIKVMQLKNFMMATKVQRILDLCAFKGKFISSKNLTFKKKIGVGGFGVVNEYVWDNGIGRQSVAVKEINSHGKEFEEFLEKEIKLLAKLQHKNIMPIYGYSKMNKKFCLVMELAEQSLDTYLEKKDKDLSEKEAVSLAVQIAKGLKYLHDNNIKHNDIKSLNVLLYKNGVAKLSDLGCATMKNKLCKNTGMTGKATISKSSNVSKTKGASQVVGSLLWQAPELIPIYDPNTKTSVAGDYTKEADIYSYGVVLWEILARKTPFFDYIKRSKCSSDNIKSSIESIILEESMLVIVNGQRVRKVMTRKDEQSIPSAIPVLKGIIEDCWKYEPKERTTIGAILQKLEESFKHKYPDIFVETKNAFKTPTKYPDKKFLSGSSIFSIRKNKSDFLIKQNNNAQKLLQKHIEMGYTMGKAYDQGGCFYDAIAQALNVKRECSANCVTGSQVNINSVAKINVYL